jgi:hypothetical protein
VTIENELIEMQAKVLIEQLLLRRESEMRIVAAMAGHKLGLKKTETKRLIKAIKEEWLAATEEVREERREQQRRSLHLLYSTAFEQGKLSTCLGIERLLAEMDGTLAPKRVHVAGSKRDEDEFDDRSELELDYYARHGEWPKEEQTKEVVH